MSKKKKYAHSEYKICSLLKQYDTFIHYKGVTIDGVYSLKEWVYTLAYKPVHFKYSGNWALRVFAAKQTKNVNGKISQLTETLYLNDKNIDKFKFDIATVAAYNASKPIRVDTTKPIL